MALVAPWLDYTPAFWLDTMNSGARLGTERANQTLKAAAEQNAAQQAADQLRFHYAQLGSNQAAEAAKRQQAANEFAAQLGQKQYEFGHLTPFEQGKLDIAAKQADLGEQKAADLSNYRTTRLGQFDAGQAFKERQLENLDAWRTRRGNQFDAEYALRDKNFQERLRRDPFQLQKHSELLRERWKAQQSMNDLNIDTAGRTQAKADYERLTKELNDFESKLGSAPTAADSLTAPQGGLPAAGPFQEPAPSYDLFGGGLDSAIAAPLADPTDPAGLFKSEPNP